MHFTNTNQYEVSDFKYKLLKMKLLMIFGISSGF